MTRQHPLYNDMTGDSSNSIMLICFLSYSISSRGNRYAYFCKDPFLLSLVKQMKYSESARKRELYGAGIVYPPVNLYQENAQCGSRLTAFGHIFRCCQHRYTKKRRSQKQQAVPENASKRYHVSADVSFPPPRSKTDCLNKQKAIRCQGSRPHHTSQFG